MMRTARWVALSVMIVAAVSFGDVRGQDDLKQFLNVKAPETSLNAPIVWTFQGKTTLIGLYHRNLIRDVSVLQFDGKSWKPLGENGLHITGVEGNFLSDFSIDKEGRPWILTYYTRPSNPVRANRFFLYTLKDQRWVLVGPIMGHKAKHTGDDTLFMRNGQTPLLYYRGWNPKTKSDVRRVFVLEEEKWVESKLGKLMDGATQVSFLQSNIFVVRKVKDMIQIHELNGDETDDLPSARHKIKIPMGQTFACLYFRNRDTFVAKLYDTNSEVYLVSYLRQGKKLVSERMTMPDDHLVIDVRWTCRGQLMLGTTDLETARVYRYDKKDHWKLVGKAKETSGGMLDFASFTLLQDDTPVITWEAFFPH